MQETHPRLIRRLIEWRYGITPQTVLNDGPTPTDISEPVDAHLKTAMNQIKAAAFQTNGGEVRVDYAQLRASEAYAQYRLCARRLQTFDPARLPTHEVRLAFWINVYNALLIDAVIAYEVQRSVKDVGGFFWRTAYNINGYRFNTFDIEHGILRANAPHPAIPGPHFSSRDPRLAYSLETLDSRIHFALVCASHSCPPIAVYDAQHVDQQLDLAVHAFINSGGVEVEPGANVVRLSRIFKWYAPDFGGTVLGSARPLLDYVTPFLSEDATRDWVATQRDRLKIRFQKYDWTLNSVWLTPRTSAR